MQRERFLRLRKALPGSAAAATAFSANDKLRLTATHLHFAFDGERRPESFQRRGSAFGHQDPASYRIGYDQHYAGDKDAHEDRIQVAGKHLARFGGQWPE